MEENKNKETAETKRDGAIIIGTAFVIGYILGRSSGNKIAIDSYRKGISDTLNSIVFTQR